MYEALRSNKSDPKSASCSGEDDEVDCTLFLSDIVRSTVTGSGRVVAEFNRAHPKGKMDDANQENFLTGSALPI